MANSTIDSGNVEWKAVVDFPNYVVSSDGRLKFVGGLQYRDGSTPWLRPPAIVATVFDKDGYLKVRMLRDGHRHKRSLHRIVAVAFIPNPLDHDQVNHIDGDKKNNAVSNLEWCNCKENHAHRRHVLKKNIGSEHGVAKLLETDILEIRASAESSNVLGKRYGVSGANIRYIRRGVTWKHVNASEWQVIFARMQQILP